MWTAWPVSCGSGGHGAALFTVMVPCCWRSCEVRWLTQLYSEAASHASQDP